MAEDMGVLHSALLGVRQAAEAKRASCSIYLCKSLFSHPRFDGPMQSATLSFGSGGCGSCLSPP